MYIYKLIMQCWSMITQNFLTLNVGAIKGSNFRYPDTLNPLMQLNVKKHHKFSPCMLSSNENDDVLYMNCIILKDYDHA